MITGCLGLFFILSWYFGALTLHSLAGALSIYIVFQIGVITSGVRFLAPFGFWLVVLWLLVF